MWPKLTALSLTVSYHPHTLWFCWNVIGDMPLISTTISADFHLESVYDEVTGCSTWQSSYGHQFNRENCDFFHSFFVSHNPTDSILISRTGGCDSRGLRTWQKLQPISTHRFIWLSMPACIRCLTFGKQPVPWISQSMKTYSGHFHLRVVQFVPSVSVYSIEQFYSTSIKPWRFFTSNLASDLIRNCCCVCICEPTDSTFTLRTEMIQEFFVTEIFSSSCFHTKVFCTIHPFVELWSDIMVSQIFTTANSSPSTWIRNPIINRSTLSFTEQSYDVNINLDSVSSERVIICAVICVTPQTISCPLTALDEKLDQVLDVSEPAEVDYKLGCPKAWGLWSKRKVGGKGGVSN